MTSTPSLSPTGNRPTRLDQARAHAAQAAGGLAVFAALVAGQTASAQNYVSSISSEPWTDIASIPGIGALTTQSFLSFGSPTTDDGDVVVNFPFTFSFLGQNQTNINVGSNGYAVFGASATSLSNVALGASAAPNNFIAPFWDDLLHASAASVRSGTYGSAPNRVFVIQAGPCTRFPGSGGTFNYQFRFYETSGRFDYRATGNLVGTSNGSSGWEGPNGSPSFAFLSCSPNCTTADATAMAGNVYSVQAALEPELTATFGTNFPRGAFPGQSAVGQINIVNRGINTAASVGVNFYLSLDNTYGPEDILAGTATVANVLGQGVGRSFTATISAPLGTPAGDYLIVTRVDPGNRFVEADEANNIVVSSFRFATGYDLSLIAAGSSNGGNPGTPITFTVGVANGGVPYVGNAEVSVYASLDEIFDATDIFIVTGPITLNGALTQSTTLNATLPSTVVPGNYYTIATIDPNNTVAELNESNNSFTSNTTFPSGPNFQVTSVTAPNQAAQGSTFSVATVVRSNAVPYGGPLNYRLFISTDATFDPADVLLGNFTVTLAGQPSVSANETVTMPANAPSSVFIIAVLDPTNLIRELNETDNTGVSTSATLTGFDFRAANVTVSPTASAGTPVTVTAQIQSVGLNFTGQLPYRIYFSPDDTWDAADEPIYDGTVFLAGLSQTNLNVTFPLPATAPVRSFRCIVYVDADNTLREADETNNTSVSPGEIRIRGADLLVPAFTAPRDAFMGIPYPVTITLRNDGEVAAQNFIWTVHISDNDIIRVTDPRLYTSGSTTLDAGDSLTITTTVSIPIYTATVSKYLGAIVDTTSQVAEQREGNNVRAIPTAIRVLFPIPDLTGAVVQTATAAAAGEPLAVTRILRNIGVADANNFTYRYYLSSNPTVSTDDVPVSDFTLSIPEGGDDYRIDTLQIPGSVAPGRYYIGIVIDPAAAVQDVNRENNTVVGPQIQVFAPAIRFVTQTLPRGTLGVPYEAGLFAAGGAQQRSWSVSRGTLPAGLALDAQSGIISGTPTSEGLAEFTIRASSGTAFAERDFSIRIVAPSVTLTIVDAPLPPGLAGREYDARVVAVGGSQPYTFAITAGLPGGFRFSPAGRLYGTPPAPGNFAISVEVRDALGATANRTLSLNVSNPGQALTIVQQPLKVATVGVEYSDPDPVALSASGGIQPYSWSVIGTGVPGLTITADGEGAGTLRGVPTTVGEFPLLVRVQDQTGLFDTSLFIVQVEAGNELRISTADLDAGKVKVAYAAELKAIRGSEPYTWAVVAGALPAGITLAADGKISGTPTAAGVFAFAISVTDAQLRTDVRPFSIVVAPEPAVVPQPEKSGCSTTGPVSPGTSLANLLLGLGLFAFTRARRRSPVRSLSKSGLNPATMVAVTLALGGALASFEAQAQTQVPGTPYVTNRRMVGLANLASPTVLIPQQPVFAFPRPVQLTLPFDFKYYDNTFNVVTVAAEGYLAMGSVSQTPFDNVAPGGGGPFGGPDLNGFIAPFWDASGNLEGGDVSYSVEGVAPSRVLTIQWTNMGIGFFTTSPGATFQVRLFEGLSGRIQVRYGSLASPGSSFPSASMGMDAPDGTRPIQFDAAPACLDQCQESDFQALAGTELEYLQDPGIELAALGVTPPEFGYINTPLDLRAIIANAHGRAIGPFVVSVDLSRSPRMTNPTRIYTSSGLTFPPFSQRELTLTVTPPVGLSEGEYYVQLIVDSGNAVAEVNETNNTIISTSRLRILQGRPDFSVDRVWLDNYALTAGQPVQVYARIRNAGSDRASAQAAVMLSSNPAITGQDDQLAPFTIDIAAGETITTTQTVTLPAGTNSGSYYIGVLADSGRTVDELSESNNGLAAFTPVTISGGNLAITTIRLPEARVGVPYTGLLAATGGRGPYRWAITSGRLPANLGLVASTGEIFGRVVAVGETRFTVQVTSDGQTVTRDLSIVVSNPQAPLTVVTRAVGVGTVGQEYSFELIATGGVATATRTWSGTGLPDGLRVTPEGLLAGLPTAAATTTISVSVTDGTATANRDLVVRVSNDGRLLIDTTPLPNAKYQEAYSATLTAKGGILPLTWTIDSGVLPPGLGLSTGGVLSGTPSAVGTFRVVIRARDSATRGLSAADLNTFELTVDQTGAFTITTATLPTAYTSEAFDQSIAATGGVSPLTWRVVGGRLPNGIDSEVSSDTASFRIVGSPPDTGVSNFLVQVTDAAGRTAIQPFALQVVTRPPAPVVVEKSGCSTTGAPGSGAMLAFVAAGLLVARRRRR